MLESQEYTGAGAFVGNTYITGNGTKKSIIYFHNLISPKRWKKKN